MVERMRYVALGRAVRGIGAIMLVLSAWLLAGQIAWAELKIDITRGNVDPMPIAVPDFFAKGADAARIGRNIARVISNDLDRSGLFRPLDCQWCVCSNFSGQLYCFIQ